MSETIVPANHLTGANNYSSSPITRLKPNVTTTK